MAETRRERLGRQILAAMQWHEDEYIRNQRAERLPGLVDAFQKELRHTECPRCNSRDVPLTEMKVGYRSGQLDKAEHICALCLTEVRAGRFGVAPVYTKR